MSSLWRSLLFVPATRPDRFEKAAAAGADMVCIDLEDAVAPTDKDTARDTALAFLAGSRTKDVRWILRVNSPRSATGLRDLQAVMSGDASPDALMVPKVSGGDEVRWIDGLLDEAGLTSDLIPVVESAQGLDRVVEIAGASRRAVAVGFGSADYAAEIGSDMGPAALAYARGRIASAAGRAGIPALDGVWLDFKDDVGLRGETQLIRSMGFDGKLAIHPSQVATINDVFAPGVDEIERAERIIAAAEAAKGGVATVDGQMIDEPVVVAARRTLAAAKSG